MSTTKGSFVDAVTLYLVQRRALGFDLRITGKRLLAFARFADQRAQGKPLTVALALAWAHATAQPSQLTSARRLEIVRPFAQCQGPAGQVHPWFGRPGPLRRTRKSAVEQPARAAVRDLEELHGTAWKKRGLGSADLVHPCASASYEVALCEA